MEKSVGAYSVGNQGCEAGWAWAWSGGEEIEQGKRNEVALKLRG